MQICLRPSAIPIVAEGLDPVYGARPLKRFLQRELETRIGRALIAGGIPDGATIIVDLKKGAIAIRREQPAPEPAAGAVGSSE